MKRYRTLLVIAALGLLPASCGPEGLQDTVRETVSFVVTAATAPSTKATFYDTDNLPASLGLLPYTREEGSTSWALYPSGGVTPLVRDGRETGITSGKWIPAPESRLLWPREGYIRFFAYAPYVGGSADPVSVTTAYPPTLSYTVPQAVSAQRDLLVTDTESSAERSGDPGWRAIDVKMNMLHALTAVRFRIVKGLQVKSLKIEDVYKKGTLDLTSPSSWTPAQDKATYTLVDNSSPAVSLGAGLKEEDGNTGYNIVEDRYIFILLPQTLPAGAKISVEVEMAGAPAGLPARPISSDIGGQVWRPGTMVTYTITRDGGSYGILTDYNVAGDAGIR